MARAWIELPAGYGWGPARALRTTIERLGYRTAELRGTGPVLLRVAGARLDQGELLRLPGQR